MAGPKEVIDVKSVGKVVVCLSQSTNLFIYWFDENETRPKSKKTRDCHTVFKKLEFTQSPVSAFTVTKSHLFVALENSKWLQSRRQFWR